MHGPIREHLEDLLTVTKAADKNDDLLVHLSSCDDCLSELEEMKEQSELFRHLRSREELEPAPGFYGRVLQRLEDGTSTSIWSILIYSAFGKRLMYGSLSAALILGTYVITQESLDGHLRQRAIALESQYDAPVVGSLDEQRDAVLENFAAYSNRGTQATPVTYRGTLQ